MKFDISEFRSKIMKLICYSYLMSKVLFFSYIVVRTNYSLMKWWWWWWGLFCT